MSTPVTQPPMPPGVIRFENVSKFYGDVLGVNRVTLAIPPGITSLVGPNGSGKTTLMNLMAGLISPSDGQLSVLGITPDDPERLFRILGYCAQFDTFPRGVTGFQFLRRTLLLHGLSNPEAESQAWAALERVGMTEAAHRSVAAYSKGMRQRVKLAQALAHRPRVLLLDEPLNGLDPMARAETLALFRALGAEGMHVIVSSHILHEVDQISDQVILINQGYVVAEGQIRGVRSEVTRQPMQIHVRSDQPRQLAREMMLDESVVEAKILSDGSGVLFRTLDVEQFYDHFEQVVLSMRLNVQQLRSTDEDADSVYHYLIGEGGGAS
jgi:ABC-2 type transport system ATP-binding protein